MRTGRGKEQDFIARRTISPDEIEIRTPEGWTPIKNFDFDTGKVIDKNQINTFESQLTDIFNSVKGETPSAPRAQQGAGTRIVTPEGRRFVENPRAEEEITEQGYKDANEIEDLINVPIRTGEETPDIIRISSEMGYDTTLPKINGVSVGELAGQRFFGTGTRIREIENEIARIRGQRLAGNIDPKEANELVEKLNKDKKLIADKVGVAIRADNNKPAIRQSGVYAEKVWETDNYADIKGKALSLNFRDFGFTIDGITAEEAARRGGFKAGAHLQKSVRKLSAVTGLLLKNTSSLGFAPIACPPLKPSR